jgi:hypothetical protein
LLVFPYYVSHFEVIFFFFAGATSQNETLLSLGVERAIKLQDQVATSLVAMPVTVHTASTIEQLQALQVWLALALVELHLLRAHVEHDLSQRATITSAAVFYYF